MSKYSNSIVIIGLGLAGFSTVRAARPPAAIVEERRELDVEIDMLHRKNDALEKSVAEHRARAKERLRTLYKMARGGYARLAVGAETADDFFLRRDAAARVVRRDLDELHAVAQEQDELHRDESRLRDRERRALELAQEAEAQGVADGAHAGGFPSCAPPVAGGIVARFGPTRDAQTNLEITRDGIELRAASNDEVRAVAAGTVRSIGPAPGLGNVVVLDHGGGWTSLTGRLAQPAVAVGQTVALGDHLGYATGPTVALQLAQGGTFVDPAPILHAPPLPTPHASATLNPRR